MRESDWKSREYKIAVETIAIAYMREGMLRELKEMAKQWPMSVYPDAYTEACNGIRTIAGPTHYPNPRKG